MTVRKNILILLLVLVVGLSIRLIMARYETEVGVDSVHYILEGDNIAHGRGWDTWDTTGGRWIVPLLFPVLVAMFRLLGAGLEWSGHLAAVAAGTLLLIPIYLLTRRLMGPGTALTAAWIAAFTPILVDYSAVILTECLFAACALTVMIYAHRAFSERGTLWDGFWSGIWTGLAFLTRSAGLFILVFLLLGFMFGKGGHSRISPIKQVGLALIGFLLLSAPYWVSLRQSTGRWVIDGRFGSYGSKILYSGNPDEEIIFERYSGELTPDRSDFLINSKEPPPRPSQATPLWILSNYVKKYAQKLVHLYTDFPFTPTYPNGVALLYLFPIFLLALGFFPGKGRWKDRENDRFLLYWLIPFVFGIPLVFVEVRYYIPVIPLLIPFMARGVEEIARWAHRRFMPDKRKSEEPLGLTVSAVILIFALLATPKITYKITHWNDPMLSYNPRKAAAEWLLDNGHHPARIMEYGHSVSFYAGAQSIIIPMGNVDDVVRIARKYGVEILSLDEFYNLRANRRPELDFLFSSDGPVPPDLMRIYSDERHPELHHYLYMIRPRSERSD